MSKLMTTPTLLALNRTAIRKRYNQSMKHDLLVANLDPEGVHVTAQPFEMADGALVRCVVLMKINGKDDPVEGVLDIEMGEYNRLQTYEQYKAKVGIPG